MSIKTDTGLWSGNKLRIIAGAFGFWLIIGLMIYMTELIAHHFFPDHFLDMVEQRQYLLRWLLWLLLTPLIVFLGARINTASYRLPWFVLLHLLLGTAILVLEFFIEASIIKPLAEQVYNRRVILGELILPFLFKYFAYIVIYFLIVGIVNLYRYMSQVQAIQRDLMQTQLENKELQYQVALSQLQALKMQIHPHFLFNTHHAVISLIQKGAGEDAARMLSLLSRLLRLTLERQDKEMVSLQEEMRLADLYLQIQQIRFSDRLSYHSDIPADTLGFPVPFFIVQPLAENAMIHGIEQTDGPAVLEIAARRLGTGLEITVANTAPEQGLPVVISPGIGISNVTERLRQYYGDAATFRLTEADNGRIIAVINLPYER